MTNFRMNKIVSILLAIVMVISALPLNVFYGENVKASDDSVRTLTLTDDNVTVSGALPKGTTLSAQEISNPFAKKRGVKGVTEAESEDEIITYSAYNYVGLYDITLYRNGTELQPDGTISVSITDEAFGNYKELTVIHVLDSEEAIRAAQKDGKAIWVNDTRFVAAFTKEAAAAKNVTGMDGVVVIEEIPVEVTKGDKISFKTGSFSIFAVVESGTDARLKVSFYNGETLVASILVKQADTVDTTKYEATLYDPGLNLENSTEKLFRGWIGEDPGNDYTAEDADNALTIADIRTIVKNKLTNETINDLDEIKFYAMIFIRFTVTYLDKAGVVSLGRDFVLSRATDNASENGVDYQINMNYVPDTQDEDFKGWQPINDETAYPGNIDSIHGNYDPEYQEDEKPGSDVEYTEGYAGQIYVNPCWIKVKGDLYLKAYSPSGYWLSFQQNGKGASYTPPQFIESSITSTTVTVRPDDPTRLGYDFGGWYEPVYETVDGVTQPAKDDNGNVILSDTPFTFGTKIDHRITVYAKWTPKATADYTVIIWKERMSDTYAQNGGTGEGKEKNYDFAESFSLNGNTGDIITTVTRSTESYVVDGDNDSTRYYNAVVNGETIEGVRTKATYTGFHCSSIDENVTIAPEGTSVVNVYYDRNTVKYTFYTYSTGGGYSVSTSDNEPQYGLVNGEFVRLVRSSRDVTVWTPAYTYTRVVATNNDGTQYALIDGEYIQLTRMTTQVTTYTWYRSGHTNQYYYSFYEDSTDGIFYIRSGNNYIPSGYTMPTSYASNVADNPPPDDSVTYYNKYYSSYYTLVAVPQTTTGYAWYLNGEQYDGNRYTRTAGGTQYTGQRYLLENGSYVETEEETGTQYYIDSNGGHVQLNKGTETQTVWLIPTFETVYEPDENGEYGLVDGEYVKLNPVVNYTYTPTGYTYTYTTYNNTSPQQYGVVNGNIQEVYYRRGNGMSSTYRWRISDNNGATRYYGYRYTRTNTTNTNSYNGTLYSLIEGTAGENQSGFEVSLNPGANNLYGSLTNNTFFQLTTTSAITGYTYNNGTPYPDDGERFSQHFVENEEKVVYEGTRYEYTTGTGWHVYQANVGLYGEPLPWPTDTSYWWYPTGNNNGTTDGMRMTYKSDFIPVSDDMTVDYYGSKETGSGTITFYTQDITGGENYSAAATVSTSGGGFNINDKFTGFTAYEWRTGGSGSWTRVGALMNQNGNYYYDAYPNQNGYQYIPSSNNIEIRFNRITGAITFMDGKYFNGDGVGTGETPKGDAFKTSQTYFYEADVSTYNKEGADYYEPPVYHEGYVFAGWYADDACTHVYNFNTMPAGGITVYAKWILVQYRVFLHPGVPTDDASLEWGDNTQAMTFRIDYGEKISGGQTVMGERDLYELVGWYYDPDFKKPFNFDAYELNDTTVKEEYDKTTTYTDYMGRHGIPGWWDETDMVNYADDLNPSNGTAPALGTTVNKDQTKNRFWITRVLNLYAKWKHKIEGADGVYLEYDAGEGSFIGEGTPKIYSDGILYDDAAHTYGIAASVAPQGQYFRYWVVQKWVDGAYEDTDDIVYPGEMFHIDYTLARQETIPENERIDDEHIYNYYMRLKAVYSPAEPSTTTVKYDPNGGTWNLTADEQSFSVIVNEAFALATSSSVSYEGHKFLGWAFTSDATEPFFTAAQVDQEGGFMVAADNLVRPETGNSYPDDNENTLYAVWDLAIIPVDIEKVLPNDTVDDQFTILIGGGQVVENGKTYVVTDGTNAITQVQLAQNGSTTIYVPYGATINLSENGNAQTAKYKAPVYSTTVATGGTIDGSAGTYLIKGTDSVSAGKITVTNEVRTYKVKIVKDADGEFPADTTFQFHTSLGDDFTLGLPANGENAYKEFTEVKYGTVFTLSEDANNAMFTQSNPVLSGNGILTNDGYEVQGDVVITFTNTIKSYEVSIKKVLENRAVNDDWATYEFPIKYTVTDANNNPVSVGGTDVQGVARITLKGGQTTAEGTIIVPYGGKVVVEELTSETFNNVAISDMFDVSYSNNSHVVTGAENEDRTIVVTNTRKQVTLNIKKIVDSLVEADQNASFSFTITAPEIFVGEETTARSSYTITVNGGQTSTETIKVPKGATVTVTETTTTDYIVTSKVGETATGEESIEFTANDNSLVEFTNKRPDQKVTITKEFKDRLVSGDADRKFTISVTYVGSDGQTVTVNDLKLKDGETSAEYTVKYGSAVTVQETVDGTQFETAVIAATTGSMTSVTSATNIKVTNKRKTATAIVQKTVVGLTEDMSVPFTFTLTATVGEGEDAEDVLFGTETSKTVTLYGQASGSNKQSETITLPAGAVLTVKETANTNYITTVGGVETLEAVTDEVTAENPATVEFVNTRIVEVVFSKVVVENGYTGSDYKWDNYTISFTKDGVADSVEVPANGSKTIKVPYGTVIAAIEEDTTVVYPNTNVKISDVYTTTYNPAGKTITANAATNGVTVTNTRNVYTITIEKLASGFAADKQFTFNPTGVLGTTSFTLYGKAGVDGKPNTKVFENIPFGSTFTISEADGGLEYTAPEGVVTAGTIITDGSNYTVSGNATITFNNEIKTYPLTVKKTVTSDDPADKDGTNKFDISVTYKAPDSDSFVTLTFTGDATGGFADGEQRTTVAIPYGSEYTVTEALADENKYTVVVSYANSEHKITGVANSDHVEVQNTRNTVKVDITKVLDNKGAGDDWDTFAFPMTAVVKNEQGTVIKTITGNDLKIAGGATKTIEIPYGATVTVSEDTTAKPEGSTYTTADLFETTNSSNNGTAFTGTKDTVVGTITVTNTRKLVKIYVHKTVDSVVADDLAHEFQFSVTAPGVNATATAKNGKTSTQVIEVPKGAEVTVYETDGTGFTVTSLYGSNAGATDGKGTITFVANDDKNGETVNFTNKREPVKVNVKKIFKDRLVQNDATRTFEIKVTYVPDSEGQTAATATTATINLKDGASQTFMVEYGTNVTISEPDLDTDQFVPVDAVNLTNVTTEQNVEITNKRKTVTFTVNKVVNATDTEKATNFTFLVNYAKVGEESVTIEGLFDSFQLNGTNNTSKTFTLPAGVELKVSETPNTDYATTVTHGNTTTDGTSYETAAALKANDSVTFTNTRLIKVTFKKVVEDHGVTNYTWANYTFNYKQDGVDETITVPANGSAEITVPYGTVISDVVEDTTVKFESTDVKVSDVYTTSETVAETNATTGFQTFTITNERKKVNVIVTKVATDWANGKTFSFTEEGLGTTNGQFTFTVGGTMTQTFEVYVGTVVDVNETVNALEFAMTKVVSGWYEPAEGGKYIVIGKSGNDEFTITFTNVINTYPLFITKEIVSTDPADLTKEFTFTINYTNPLGQQGTATVKVKLNNTTTGTVSTASIPLLLPYGTEYTVTEVDPTDGNKTYTTQTSYGSDPVNGKYYITAVEGTNGIDESATNAANTVTVKNTRNPYKVTVIKQTSGNFAGTEVFNFTSVGLGLETENGSFSLGYDASSQQNVWSQVFQNIAYGTVVTIAEATNPAYTTVIEVTEGAEYIDADGKISGDVTFTVTNTRVVFDVKIVKELDNKTVADGWKTFSFPFTYKVTYPDGTTIVKNADNFGIVPGETGYTITGVPYGSKVEVAETVSATGVDGAVISNVFTTTVDGADGSSKTIDSLTEAKTITFKNTRKMVTLDVSKALDTTKWNITADKDVAFSFSWQSDIGDQDTYKGSFTLKDGETYGGTHSNALITVPYGAKVTVTEDLSGDAYKAFEFVSATGGTVTGTAVETAALTADGTTVAFTNRHKNITVTVKKVVTHYLDEDLNRTFSFTKVASIGSQSIFAETAFTLKNFVEADNNVHTFDLPYGATVKVAEANANGFASTATLNGAAYDESDVTLTDDAEIVVTNDRLWKTVKVTKAVSTDASLANIDNNIPFSFKYSWTLDYSGENTLSRTDVALETALKNGESTTFTVPINALVTVEEIVSEALSAYNNATVSAIFTTTNDKDTGGDHSSFNVGDGDSVIEITFTNTHKTVDIYLDKEVNLDQDANTEFKFNYTNTLGDITIETASGSAIIKPSYANTKIATVPVGTTFTITEETVEGFNSTYASVINNTDAVLYDLTVTINNVMADQNILYTNNRALYDITVTKVVDSKVDADDNFEFPFYYTIDGGTQVAFTLKHGGSKVIKDVPYGAKVVIAEKVSENSAYGTGTVNSFFNISDVFTTSYKIGTGESVNESSVTIDKLTGAVSIEFTNVHKTVKAQIKKVIDRTDWELAADLTQEFAFSYSTDIGGVNGTVTLAAGSDNGGVSGEITVPYAAKLTVTETAVDGFDLVGVNGATLAENSTTATTTTLVVDLTTVTFTNKRQTVEVEVTKKVTGLEQDLNVPFTFNATATLGDETVSLKGTDGGFTLMDGSTHNGMKQTIEIPYGATLVVTEDTSKAVMVGDTTPYKNAEGNAASVAETFSTTVTIGDGYDQEGNEATLTGVTANTSVLFGNNHKTVEITVKKVVDSANNSDFSYEFPFIYTINGANAANDKVLKHGDANDITLVCYYGTDVTLEEALGNDDAKFITGIDALVTDLADEVESITFVATAARTVTFYNKRAAGDLVITKTVYAPGEGTVLSSKANVFIFKVTKAGDSSFNPLFVTIAGTGSVTIKGVEAGTYNVEELTAWSWEYTLIACKNADGSDGVLATATTTAVVLGGDTKTVTYTNRDKAPNWLRTETSKQTILAVPVPATESSR